MNARDPMTELAVTMEQLTTAVQILNSQFGVLRDEKVADISVKLAIMETNLGRLQTIVYTALAAVGLQALAGLSGLLIWAIKR